MRLRPGYAAATIALLLIEIAIAVLVHDTFVRPHLGDALAVALVYCALRAIAPLKTPPCALLAFLVACAMEIGQYFHLVEAIGLGGSRIARVVLGTDFDASDFLAYAAGALGVLVAERVRRQFSR